MREEWPSTAGRPVALAAMVDERGTQARPDGAGMTGAVECRYYGRDFTAEEMARCCQRNVSVPEDPSHL